MRHHLRTSIAVCAGALAAVGVLTVTACAAPGQGTAGPAPAGSGDGPPATRGAAVKTSEQPRLRQDFDGDGYEDLVIGAPGPPRGSASGAGHVVVIRGSAHGLDPSTRTVLDQDTPGVPGKAAPGNHFGTRLTARDLDGDGFADLAVSSPGASAAGSEATGTVTVLWGGESGLTGKGAALLTLSDGAAAGLGGHLTAGDFDGDGEPDLLAEAAGSTEYALFKGPFTRAGKPASLDRVALTDDDSSIESLVAGDVTGDGADDLVVVLAFEERSRPGRFYRGGAKGLSFVRELPHAANGTIGDFDGDGHGDFAYREVPNDVVENLPYDPGTVKVLRGTASGPGSRITTLTQDTPGAPDAEEEGDQFGATLAAGDVNGDGYDDLAVGVPFETVSGESAAGTTMLFKGGAKGLTGTGAQAFHQDTEGVGGVAEADDRFGGALVLLDTDKDGHADLAASAPGENGGNGAVWLLPGTSSGLTASGSLSFGPGEVGVPQDSARFGETFAGSDQGRLLSRN